MVVEILRGVLQGVSNFLTSFFNVIGGSLNPAAVEGIVCLFALGIILRILNGGVNLPKVPKINRRKKEEPEDDDEGYEYIRVRRRRRRI